MMSHIDCWATLAGMAGIPVPPTGEMKDNNGKPIYFDSIDNSAYILGKSPHSARKSWIFINGEYLHAVRADIGGDPKEPWLNIAWKFVWTAKDTWLGPNLDTGSIPAVYNLTMDPFEKYDMVFNGAAPDRAFANSPGKYAGQDNGWATCTVQPGAGRVRQVDHEVSQHQAVPGRCVERSDSESSNPENPVPALDPNNMPKTIPGGGD